MRCGTAQQITRAIRLTPFAQIGLRRLCIARYRYAIVPKEKRKVLEEIMRSDKRINPCK